MRAAAVALGLRQGGAGLSEGSVRLLLGKHDDGRGREERALEPDVQILCAEPVIAVRIRALRWAIPNSLWEYIKIPIQFKT